MTPAPRHHRVAAIVQRAGIPITPAGVAEIEAQLIADDLSHATPLPARPGGWRMPGFLTRAHTPAEQSA